MSREGHMGQLIVSIPRTAAGEVALRHLRGPGADLFRIGYVESLSQRLRRPGLESAGEVDRFGESFHLLDVPLGEELAAIIRLSQFHNQPEPRGMRGKI